MFCLSSDDLGARICGHCDVDKTGREWSNPVPPILAWRRKWPLPHLWGKSLMVFQCLSLCLYYYHNYVIYHLYFCTCLKFPCFYISKCLCPCVIHKHKCMTFCVNEWMNECVCLCTFPLVWSNLNVLLLVFYRLYVCMNVLQCVCICRVISLRLSQLL